VLSHLVDAKFNADSSINQTNGVSKMSGATRIGKQITNTVFNAVMLISAFAMATVSLAMPWEMRCAFSSVLLNSLDTMMKNEAILRVALDVRWKTRR